MSGPILAIAQATRLELIRRPGLLLTCVGAGALILVLHDLSATAFDSTGSLARELTHSTIALVLALVGGVSGVRATTSTEELGPTPEILTSPTSSLRYVVGRFLGICQSSLLFLGVLLVFAVFASLRVGEFGGSEAFIALVGALLSAAMFTAVGLVLGSLAPFPLALLLLITSLVVARLGIPALAAAEGNLATLSLLLPDPSRLDLAREVGFGRPISTLSTGLGWAAATLQIGALLLLAATLIEKRRR